MTNQEDNINLGEFVFDVNNQEWKYMFKKPGCVSVPFFCHFVDHLWLLLDLNTLSSVANQVRVCCNESRQPIGIEYYVIGELSAKVEDPSRLSARLGLL